MYGGERGGTRDVEDGRREEGIGERRSRRAGPVPPRSHVRPYDTRNTCNTDNTCNTCNALYGWLSQRRQATTTGRIFASLRLRRDFPRDLWVPAGD